jgi:multiple antibiotic resistance protein
MWDDVVAFCLLSFTSVFFIVNPFGAVPVFLALTTGWDGRERRRAALRSVLIAGGVLTAFLLAGNLIFRLFGISLGAFRLAGGLLLLKVAMDMLHGQTSRTKSTAEDHAAVATHDDIGVTPMGVPQLAGPGSIATVILLPGEPRELWRFFPVIGAVLLTLLLAWVLMRYADRVLGIIGESGARILSKIMGLLIAAVAVQFLAYGVRDLLPVILERTAG